MIMLCSRKDIDTFTFDKVWFATHTCPGMGPGCEHHPELAASEETCRLCYPPNADEEEFYRRFQQEIRSEPWQTHFKNLVKMSDEEGLWIQLIYYEKDPHDGERPYVYEVLKQMTNNVVIK